ncbi:MAG: hypothetical protein ACHRXM_28450 [Isosphaerales bacterium]
MSAPELEIGLYRWDESRYTVVLRFRSVDDLDFAPVEGSVKLDLRELADGAVAPESYGLKLGQSLFADDRAQKLLESSLTDADVAKVPLRIRLLIDPRASELQGLR